MIVDNFLCLLGEEFRGIFSKCIFHKSHVSSEIQTPFVSLQSKKTFLWKTFLGELMDIFVTCMLGVPSYLGIGTHDLTSFLWY